MIHKNAHYPALDGARGIAAISVFFYHISDYFGGLQFLQGSFLAVDLFFLMSGFVIALSYERSLISGTRSFRSFVWARALRLYPLYLMACGIGFTYFFVKYLTGSDDAPSMLQLSEAIPATILLAPWAPAAEWGFTPYPFAPSAWSLSFEFWYNILYALLAIRLGTKVLLGVSAISLAILIHQALQWGSIDMGWSIATMPGGSARFWFSFSVGILIFRHQVKNMSSNKAFLSLSMLCFAFVAIPKDALWLGILWIAAVFPMALVFGGAYQITGLSSKLCNHLGRLSYGIYILHAPIVLFQTGIFKVFLGDRWADHKSLIGISISASVLLLSWICTYYIDEPLRKHLKKRPIKCSDSTIPPVLPI